MLTDLLSPKSCKEIFNGFLEGLALLEEPHAEYHKSRFVEAKIVGEKGFGCKFKFLHPFNVSSIQSEFKDLCSFLFASKPVYAFVVAQDSKQFLICSEIVYRGTMSGFAAYDSQSGYDLPIHYQDYYAMIARKKENSPDGKKAMETFLEDMRLDLLDPFFDD